MDSRKIKNAFIKQAEELGWPSYFNFETFQRGYRAGSTVDYQDLLEKAAALIWWLKENSSLQGWKHTQQAKWWSEIQSALTEPCKICGDHDCDQPRSCETGDGE